MDSSASTSAPQTLLAAATTRFTARHLRISLLLLGVFAGSWLTLTVVDAESLVPVLWPAVGLAAGLLLTSPQHLRPGLTAAVFALMLAAFLLQGYDWAMAIGFSASSAAAAWVVRVQLVR